MCQTISCPLKYEKQIQPLHDLDIADTAYNNQSSNQAINQSINR